MEKKDVIGDTSCQPHIPVLLDEVLDVLSPEDGKVYVDGTFGAGGYTRAILNAAECTVYAIDRDDTVQPYADALKKEFKERFHFLSGRFSEMDVLLNQVDVPLVDGIVLDVGVSSMQLDNGERGFSFMKDAELDMRMGQDEVSAKEFVNEMAEEEMANIIYQYGGERMSRRVARAIMNARAEGPITHTRQLADIVRSAVRRSKDKIHPATRTFQAIRIWVNNELEEISDAMQAAETLLAEKGKLIVVSFHSLEDSIVKKFLKEAEGSSGANISRYMPLPFEHKETLSRFKQYRKPVKPTNNDIKSNPRCRSAILRSGIRVNRDVEQGGEV